LDGQVIGGGVLSLTVTDWKHVSARLQMFVAIHLLFIVKLLGQLPGMTISLKTMVGSPGQISVAVATPVLGGTVDSVH
jgi:hypothetical protein